MKVPGWSGISRKRVQGHQSASLVAGAQIRSHGDMKHLIYTLGLPGLNRTHPWAKGILRATPCWGGGTGRDVGRERSRSPCHLAEVTLQLAVRNFGRTNKIGCEDRLQNGHVPLQNRGVSNKNFKAAMLKACVV